MIDLPPRPDLDQLRRQAKELRRAASEGEPEAVQRIRAASDRTTLAAAQLTIAREHGLPSWPRLREEVEKRRAAAPRHAALVGDKHGRAVVYGAGDFLAAAHARGWDPGTLPIGAVFTSETFITDHLGRHPERFERSRTLRPTNASVYVTTSGAPVAVACLGVGAPALVTLLEHLVGLGVGTFVAVGPAPGIGPGVAAGDCVIIDRAVRDDGVSDHYVATARYADAHTTLTERLLAQADDRWLQPRVGPSWTISVPYRTTAEELEAYRAEGVLVTDLTTAALFAVAAVLGVRAASAVIATPTLGAVPERSWPPGSRMFELLDAAIETVASADAR